MSTQSRRRSQATIKDWHACGGTCNIKEAILHGGLALHEQQSNEYCSCHGLSSSRCSYAVNIDGRSRMRDQSMNGPTATRESVCLLRNPSIKSNSPNTNNHFMILLDDNWNEELNLSSSSSDEEQQQPRRVNLCLSGVTVYNLVSCSDLESSGCLLIQQGHLILNHVLIQQSTTRSLSTDRNDWYSCCWGA